MHHHSPLDELYTLVFGREKRRKHESNILFETTTTTIIYSLFIRDRNRKNLDKIMMKERSFWSKFFLNKTLTKVKNKASIPIPNSIILAKIQFYFFF